MSANLPSYRIKLFACSLLMLIPAVARCERLPLKPYTVADGLAHNEINRIVRDSRGFLWFCTAEGLSRFDGYEFTNFGTDQGLPHRTVNDFLETRNGELWVATNAGVVRFDPKGTPTNRVVYLNDVNTSQLQMFSVVVPEDQDRQARAVNVIFERRDGTIWIGTQKGLFTLQRVDGHFNLRFVELKISGLNSQPHVYDIVEDRRGSLWLATSNALARVWPDGSTAGYRQRDGLPDELVQDLLEDRQGRLWAGTRGAGLVLFTADETHAPPHFQRTYSEREGLTTPWVSQLFQASDGRFWVATSKGLAEFFPDAAEHESKFKTYTQRNGLLYWGVNNVNEDARGNLWLGTDAGTMKLARNGFITYGEQDGLLAVTAIFEDRTGGVCFRGSVFGDERTSVFEGAKLDFLRLQDTFYPRFGRFDGHRFTWLRPESIDNSQLGWVGELVTLQTHNGEWWFGTGAGVYRFPSSDDFAQLKRARPLAVYTTKDGLKAQQVFRMFEDSVNRMWVSTIQSNGLAYWERIDETWHDLTNAAGLPSPTEDLARSFGEDNEGNIWIGFNTGVARYRKGSFDFFSAKDGLPPGSLMNILKDHAGRLWLTSSRSGLIRVDNPEKEHPTFVNYTTAEGLSSNSAEAITEDLSGRIYVSTGRGLDRLDPITGRFKTFTTADGLVSGPMRVAFRDQQGGLWFGTGKGMSRLFPGAEQPSPPPPVMITSLRIAGEQQHVSALGESAIALRNLTSSENQLQIDFVGLSFEAGEILRYQYKLAGSRGDWSLPSQQRTVTLASLAPGHYEFLVRAVNSDGVASVKPASIAFTIMPPFWQRWWFVTLVVLAICLAVYMVYRYRVTRIVELANVRTRIASDLHDDIGANLTKISILSEVARQQSGNGAGEKDSPLVSIARISRESVASMSDIVWAINPQRDSLRDVIRRMRLHAEETCLPQQIELEFEAPEDVVLKLGIETRRCLYLVFKEALNNAARHSGCWRISVSLALDKDMLRLKISDNGLGFEVSTNNDGNGLLSMHRRADSLGGKVEVESSVGMGTTVQLRLPYSRSSAFSRIRS